LKKEREKDPNTIETKRRGAGKVEGWKTYTSGKRRPRMFKEGLQTSTFRPDTKRGIMIL